MKKMLIILFMYALPAWGQSPTIVYGESETAPNKADEYILIQPANSPNPLGNPIVAPQTSDNTQSNTSSLVLPHESTPTNNKLNNIQEAISQSSNQNPPPFSESPQQQQNQIQNTLYQGGNRIYDVQSYPLQDIKTITEPNIDPTITTYPEY